VRLVLDTNTIVSGLLWKGPPHTLLESVAARQDLILHTSPKLLAELTDVLGRPKLAAALAASGSTPEQLFRSYAAVARVVRPESVPAVIVSDPDDDQVLACALAARADLIVSGDAHLLNLKAYHRISIVTTAEALARLPQPKG
jgi:putative PIN family toxin of toxin-antitoxin system